MKEREKKEERKKEREKKEERKKEREKERMREQPCTMIWFCPDNIESGGKCGFAQY